LKKLLILAVLASGGGFAVHATDLSKPQASLAKEDLVIVTHDGKPHLFHVEMAVTPDQQEIGLMWRTSVAADQGMLFDSGAPQIAAMWMKNTLIPLDMLFIAADGRVAAVTEDAVPQSLAVISSGVPVRATLELQAGIAEALDIRVGDKVQQRIFTNTK
jgi:uncharacterized membrane protein (UPF0127 family)